ncbi:peptide chain release factor N(5)-glutamine methyltransferase [Idiomarina tyrosinivorans]|uniref:Release factor glutamine methyltransferase n=1 Tax=Idiomarina tyrosinivorans TaxID=1445662 RepID=A0A432ZRL3_9GAMM|nr:peptide chain release factor N(5)-glutamine methyltransferase [Idiomarina tyrosinivorans]RUO80478.1 peptide chain release factor N(5)-glutamine methyltransferase [Idiomarina tyrosinivorans]
MAEVSIAEALGWARQQLAGVDQETANADARMLLAELLGVDWSYLMTWPERPLRPQQWQQFQDWIARRQADEPLEYLTGTADFDGLKLQVTPATLIPREDTETLVRAALELSIPATAKVLDLGTGSGAIALALKARRPEWQVFGCDNSAAALQVAQQNSENLGLSVSWYQSDWFSAFSSSDKFDLIVSNPPYIAHNDPHVSDSVRRYEPATALYADADGMADIGYIARAAKQFLTANGALLFEHGWQQADQVVLTLRENRYKKVKSWKDYASVSRVTGGFCD